MKLNLEEIGWRIFNERERQGLTQEELATAADCHRHTVRALEGGEVTSTQTRTLQGIARALRCESSWLMFGRGKK